uniref:Ycf1 n=2 Tax=Ostreobium TaxID=121087 RepID=A0A1A8H0Z0_9CHLO|nr:Hypothetical protein ycf1 [Ostreobium quekettii]ANG44437.1 hypothetical chloroplast RF1 [Ostreobium sp. OS1B]SBQ76962.1 Hypothetical protein ycf1 [Ostreobium quekettii]
MSLSQFIKDYINNINDFYDSFYGHIHLTFLFKFFIFYITQSIKFLAQYILTFRWINDFYSFKVTIPQLINSNFNNLYSSENFLSNFFSFFNNPGLTPNFFISGLFNSLILAVPFSSSQILWLRRLTVEGLPSGIASGLGIILSQFLLNICILLGFRFIIFPWYSFESLHYIFGIILTLSIVYTIAHKPIKRIKSSNTTQLVKIFILHFILTWTEQSTLFQYFSNISFGPEPTLFEALAPGNGIYAILSHWSYFSGLLLGSIFWTAFFGWVVLSIGYSASKFFNFSYSIWIRSFNFSCLTLIIAFTLTSFPYYNLDYLLTSPLGFIGQDDALKGFQLRVNSIDLKKGRLGEYSSHISLDTDVSPFDRGRYQTSSEVELTFEDLNYQGEYVWRSRNDRLASGSAGIVNKLMSKFLPKLKNIRGRTNTGTKIKNNRENTTENNLLSDQNFESYSPGYTFSADNDDLVKRFLGDYQADVTSSTLPEPYNEVDQEPYSAFSELVRYGFDSFATFEDVESDEFEEKLGKKIKSKYYSNIVYKSILNIEISNFLDRQPKNYFLTKEEENSLFQKRLILANYYDSLREYSKVPYSEPFKELFLGPKSYANRVYNNQFKGTLKILRRLFSISLEKKYNRNNESILKFDQPLYKEKLNDQDPILHEELKNNPYLFKIKTQTPFLREADPIPFYAGWDDKLRKFIVTNYWLAYSDTGVKVDYSNIFNAQPLANKFVNKKSNTIHFVTWPLSKQKIEKLKTNTRNPSTLMFSSFDDPANEQQRDIFEYAESDDYDVRLIYETLPSILKRVDIRDKEKEQVYVRPLRGGILWPGSEPIKLKLKDALKVLVKLGRDWRDSNP